MRFAVLRGKCFEYCGMGDGEAEKDEILPTGDIRPAKVEQKKGKEKEKKQKEKKERVYKSWSCGSLLEIFNREMNEALKR